MRMRTNGCVFMSTFRTGSSRARYEKHLRRVFGVKENRNVSAKQNTQQSFVKERERKWRGKFSVEGVAMAFLPLCWCWWCGGCSVVCVKREEEKTNEYNV